MVSLSHAVSGFLDDAGLLGFGGIHQSTRTPVGEIRLEQTAHSDRGDLACLYDS